MSDRPADEVKIKLKHGDWEIEISCAETRVKQVVENVLSSLNSKIVDSTVQSQLDAMQIEIESIRSRRAVAGESDARIDNENKTKGGMTCRGLLDSLWQEGYFSSERALGEVHEELGRKGYNYDRTAVSHSLADMVRENILTRTGTMRNFRYIQKRPVSG
ncbi:MAG TPA: hypothetical protein VGQ03_07650 [Nitrososphaera sp.]|nr:hypothetical protein [Nitrososphaera sp.]